MSDRIYLYPLWIRFWHLANALFFLILIATGLSMQYAAFIRFDIAVSLHNIFGILLTVNYLFYFIGNKVSPNGKYYKTTWKGLFSRLAKQFRYYTIGIFKHEKPPFPVTKERKFNPLQQFTYIVAMYAMVPLIIITGWALLFPEVLFNKLLGITGFRINDAIHIIMGFLLSVFMLIHIYFCTIGATFTSNFKSMVNGFHETH